jgi:hypothetical protein
MIPTLSLLALMFSAASAVRGLQNGSSNLTEPLAIRTEYLGQAHLPQSDKDAIVAFVFRDTDPRSCVSPMRSLQKELASIRIAQARLTPTSEKYLLVQASDSCHCGGTGNCSFWVLRKKPNGFDILLDTDMVQTFALERHFTHGFRDLKTSSHGSAFQSGLVRYQFDGKEYRAAECAESLYEVDDGGNVAKKPTITRVDCTETH